MKIKAQDGVTVTVTRLLGLRLVCLSAECIEGVSETWLEPKNARKLAAELVRAANEIQPEKIQTEPTR